LCNASINYYKQLETEIGLKEIGYLWLLTKDQYDSRKKKVLKNKLSDPENYSLLDFLDLQNVEYSIFNKEELKELMPNVELKTNLEEKVVNIEVGLFGKQCGTLSPDLLVKYYEKNFKEKNGLCKYNYEVTDILLQESGKEFDEDYIPTVWRNTKVGGVRVRNTKTNIEEILLSNKVVLTTGAWVNQLLYKLGIHIGINAKKRQLFRISEKHSLVINKSFKNKFNSIPFIILPSGGVFIKPISENGSVDVGCSDDISRAFEIEPEIRGDSFRNNLDNPQAEIDFYQTDVLPVLKAFFPKDFNEKVKVDHPSAGMYAYSLDKFPVITKELESLFICTGASGSGIMKGDAIARINVANIMGENECILFDGTKVRIADFSLHSRNVPKETLVL
jgi:glycine/D-amino acid oxidase-like deaminating enzyme